MQVCMMRNVCLVDGDWTIFRPAATSQTPPLYDLNLMENGQSPAMLLSRHAFMPIKSPLQAWFICMRGKDTAWSIDSTIFPDGSPQCVHYATCAQFGRQPLETFLPVI
jgi:hypothetical protein